MWTLKWQLSWLIWVGPISQRNESLKAENFFWLGQREETEEKKKKKFQVLEGLDFEYGRGGHVPRMWVAPAPEEWPERLISLPSVQLLVHELARRWTKVVRL